MTGFFIFLGPGKPTPEPDGEMPSSDVAELAACNGDSPIESMVSRVGATPESMDIAR